MDDATELRLEKVRNTLQTAHVAAQVQTNKQVALLAVALTIVAGATLSGLAGQVPTAPAALGVVGGDVLVLLQLRALEAISRNLHVANQSANAAIDRLMAPGGESDADAPTS